MTLSLKKLEKIGKKPVHSHFQRLNCIFETVKIHFFIKNSQIRLLKFELLKISLIFVDQYRKSLQNSENTMKKCAINRLITL